MKLADLGFFRIRDFDINSFSNRSFIPVGRGVTFAAIFTKSVARYFWIRSQTCIHVKALPGELKKRSLHLCFNRF